MGAAAFVSWSICFIATLVFFGWEASMLLAIASFAVLMMCVAAETKPNTNRFTYRVEPTKFKEAHHG